MCGIFGYRGTENVSEKVLEGLKRLEYRGYDSWGIAVEYGDEVKFVKKAGKIGEVKASDLGLPKGKAAIGHTRWATTGRVNDKNAHPHCSRDKSFVLAHNGIVENYKEIKKDLMKKEHLFDSETDTEVILRLIEEKLKKNSFMDSVQQAFNELEGRNTIIILRNSAEMIAARNGSPLVVGFDEKTKDVYLSSDTLSFAPYVKKIIVADNEQMVQVNSEIKIFDLGSGKEIDYEFEKLDMKSDKVDKEGFDHFMVKEINESPYVIRQTALHEKKDYEKLSEAIKKARHVYTIASGSAGLAAAQTAYYLRTHSGVRAISLIGGDSKEYFNLLEKEDLLIAPSQSGETADVLEVLEFAKTKGVKIASHVNMAGSAMTRMSDFKFMSNSGPEICVMATKTWVAQIAWGYLLAKTAEGKYEEGKKNLENLAGKMEEYLKDEKAMETLKKLADELLDVNDIFLMGKSQNLQIMNEGMVKFIEGTYKHAHSIPAGDLKHYAITLMEEGVPVIVAVSNDEVKSDLLNSVGEVKARGAKVIGISSEKNDLFDFFVEVPETGDTSAIMNVIPLQMLAYYTTVNLGNSVDHPRNIAKSVTVK